MTRKYIYDLFNALYPTYWPGQKEGRCESPYIVLKYKDQKASNLNSKAGWQYVDCMVYVPKASIDPLDTMIDLIIESIKNTLEFTGHITPDYIDVDVEGIMRSIEFRMPKVLK